MAQYELSLRDYLRIFKKRKVLILMIVIIMTMGSMVFSSNKVPVYEAYSTVKVMERQSVAGVLTEWIVYSPANIMQSEAKMIQGYPVMRKVALKLGMIKIDEDPLERDRRISSLQRMVTAKTIEDTNVIKITAISTDPKEAMDIANTVAHVYIEENLLEKRRQARAEKEFIEEQLSQIEERLEMGEDKLRVYTNKGTSAKLIGPLQEKLVTLELQLTSLMQKYTEKHPYVIRLEEQIKNLEIKLDSFSNKEDVDYDRLVREVTVNKKLYSMLKEKLEEARITEAQKVSDISLVDPAIMPAAPLGPQETFNVSIGAILGLMIGFVIAFMLEVVDTSMETIEEVEELLHLPVIGVVPSITKWIKKENIISRGLNKLLNIKKSEAEESHVRLMVHTNPTSVIAEAFRSIRTGLKLTPKQKVLMVTSSVPREGKTTILINLGMAFAQKGLKTLLISSDLRRPAVASTFGIKNDPGFYEVVAGRVKLMDAIQNVTEIMLGDMKLEDIIKSPGLGDIWILPSGRMVSNPAELIESRVVPDMIHELREKFDIILFDTPPVIPVADASILASKVDGVILCYEIGRTARNVLLRAKTQIEANGGKLLGVILNQISTQTEPVESYPYYQSDEDDKKKNKEKEKQRHKVKIA